jgi:hypothetical protein
VGIINFVRILDLTVRIHAEKMASKGTLDLKSEALGCNRLVQDGVDPLRSIAKVRRLRSSLAYDQESAGYPLLTQPLDRSDNR